MKRHSDTNVFYQLLSQLEATVGERRRLGDCHGRMHWPIRGVYFFFEPGEFRSKDLTAHRVTRIGTHALTPKNRNLWKRLREHRGTERGYGNHRKSVFRRLVGDALINRDRLPRNTWEQKTPRRPSHAIDAEKPYEKLVSSYLRSTMVLCLPVDDEPGPDSGRGIIEKNSIALLSGYVEASMDSPSSEWLGLHSSRVRVRCSGLWNNDHVDEEYDRKFLSLFEKLISKTAPP